MKALKLNVLYAIFSAYENLELVVKVHLVDYVIFKVGFKSRVTLAQFRWNKHVSLEVLAHKQRHLDQNPLSFDHQTSP